MKIKAILPLCATALFFSSCSHVFYPALFHQDVAYMPTPTSVDSAKTATYISAGVGTSTNASYNDTQVAAQLNVSKGYNLGNFDLAYGLFGVAGNYENGNIDKGKPYYFTDKFYGAVGGRVAANYVISTPKTDIRIIGLEAAYSHEFGSFSNFRNAVYHNSPDNYYVDPRNNLFTLGLTSEVVFHRYPHSVQHGVSFFLGETFGHNILDDTYYNGDDNDNDFNKRLFRSLYFKAGYFVKYKNVFAVGEVSPIMIGVRFGFAF